MYSMSLLLSSRIFVDLLARVCLLDQRQHIYLMQKVRMAQSRNIELRDSPSRDTSPECCCIYFPFDLGQHVYMFSGESKSDNQARYCQ